MKHRETGGRKDRGKVKKTKKNRKQGSKDKNGTKQKPQWIYNLSQAMLSHSLTRLHALEVINRSSLHSRGEITEGALGRQVGVLDTGDGGVAIRRSGCGH